MNAIPMKTKPNIMKPTNLFLIGLGFLLPIQPDLWAQPVPHHFTGISVSLDKAVTLSFDGSASNMLSLTGTISNQFGQLFDLYAVEASTNLTEWIVVSTNTVVGGTFSQVETDVHVFEQRFYRVRLVP